MQIGYGTQLQHTPGGLPIDQERCYYDVELSGKTGWKEMNRNKLEQLGKCTISKVGEGITQVFNNLCHPLRFTLNHHVSTAHWRAELLLFTIAHYMGLKS